MKVLRIKAATQYVLDLFLVSNVCADKVFTREIKNVYIIKSLRLQNEMFLPLSHLEYHQKSLLTTIKFC